MKTSLLPLLFLLLASACTEQRPAPAPPPPTPVPSIPLVPIDLSQAPPMLVAQHLNTAMADAVEKVLPSVVVIRTEATQVVLDGYGRLLHEAHRPVGQGSGVIIHPAGFVLTNNHVLQGGQRIEVILQNERVYEAELVGRNEQTDIAVLKIISKETEMFPSIEPGNSDTIRVGEMVLAIGSPFSLSSTVTQGVVSQKGRNEANLPIVDFIQTSAAINPGNSGGPLIDIEGRLIGINTMIRTGGPQSMGSIGIGFAVPSNTALRAAELIMQGVHPEELPWLGVMMQDTRYGVLLSRIFPDSPAAEAGLRQGDLVLSVNRKKIRSGAELSSLIRLSRTGDSLAFEVLRGRDSVQIPVTTRLMPPNTRP
jgi:serine protease Do